MTFARLCTLLVLLLAPLPAAADDAQLKEAEAAVRSFVDAVANGDRAGLAAVLAPEFQIMRSNGVGYGREDYLAQGLSTVSIEGTPVIENLTVTRQGDVMVTRYSLATSMTVSGKAVAAEAPRLSVFRREGDRWLIVAHANFAAIED